MEGPIQTKSTGWNSLEMPLKRVVGTLSAKGIYIGPEPSRSSSLVCANGKPKFHNELGGKNENEKMWEKIK
jgi:hypothetical protein